MIALVLAVVGLDDALGAVALGPVTLPPGALLVLLGLVVVALLAREVAAVARAKGVAVDATMLGLAGAAGLVVTYLGVAVAAMALMGAAVLVAALMGRCVSRRACDGAVATASMASFAYVYLGLLPGVLVVIRQEHGGWSLAGAVLVIKACDIGAYFTGRWLGRHKLIAWLSPGKTWEGLGGGVALAAVVATALAALGNAMDRGDWPLVAAATGGALLGLVGQMGDLVASALKRDANVKDAGASIPGFGGVLDVMDSLLIAGVVAWAVLAMVTQ